MPHLTDLDRIIAGARAIADSYTAPVGQTPRELIWALNKARLYRYRPTRLPHQRHPVPLLLVYALINRPYIFDLLPGQSFVEFLLAQGFDVYLLDWGAPGPEDQRTRFDDYAADYLPRAVRQVLRVSGAREFSLLGYCVGATLATLYAALHPHAPLRNLILLTPPVDFSPAADSIFAAWLDERYFDVDGLVTALGNIPAGLIEVWAKMLRPVENYVGTYVALWRRLEDEAAVRSWQAMHRWVHDGVPFAGEAFRQWVKDYVRGNELIRGVHVIRGQRVDLAAIRAALLTVVAQHDHIVPPAQSYPLMDRVSSLDKTLLTIPAGHVGLMAGRSARHECWPQIAAWLEERSS